MSVEDILEN